MTIKELIATAIRNLQSSKKDTREAAKPRLRHFHFQLSTAIVQSFPGNASESSPCSSSISSSFFSLLSGRAPLHRSIRSRRQIAAPVVEVFRKDYDEAREIGSMIIGRPDVESNETPRPKTKKKVTRKEQNSGRTKALAFQESLPSPSAVQANASEKYRLREILKAVPRSGLKSCFGR